MSECVVISDDYFVVFFVFFVFVEVEKEVLVLFEFFWSVMMGIVYSIEVNLFEFVEKVNEEVNVFFFVFLGSELLF